MHRRSLLALAAGLAILPLAARAEEEDCGCSAAKKNSSGRAQMLYTRALNTKDLERRRRLLELALKIDPEHEGAKAALAESQ